MKFPKIAVCPPMDTFTDLNYDLLLAENITLPLEDRQELLEFAIEVLEENNYMTNFEKIIDDNQFTNWYHGFTQMKPATFLFGVGDMMHINTGAVAGTVTTKFYGEQFNEDLIERESWYSVNINVPESVQGDTNVTLHFELEIVPMKDMGQGGYETYQLGSLVMNKEQTSASTSYNPPDEGFQLINGQYDATTKQLQFVRAISPWAVGLSSLGQGTIFISLKIFYSLAFPNYS